MIELAFKLSRWNISFTGLGYILMLVWLNEAIFSVAFAITREASSFLAYNEKGLGN